MNDQERSAAEAAEAQRRTLEELRAKHGRIAAFKAGGDVVVFRSCTVGERDRAKIESGDPSKRAAADKNLALSCVVHPDLQAARGILDRYPFLYDRASARIVEISGADVEELGKD